jgi:hypothetical protein
MKPPAIDITLNENYAISPHEVCSTKSNDGLTFWDCSETETSVNKIIAHISNKGVLSIKVKEIPNDVRKMLNLWANSMKRGYMNEHKSNMKEQSLRDIIKRIMISERLLTEKQYDIGSGWLGNGLTVWNRAETDSNTDDYKIIAQISKNGDLSIRDKQLPTDIKKMLQVWANSMKKGNRPPSY